METEQPEEFLYLCLLRHPREMSLRRVVRLALTLEGAILLMIAAGMEDWQ